MSDVILFAHPTFGVLGIMASVWLFVDALNASDANAARIRRTGIIIAVLIVLAYLFGGYWYTHYYGAEKAVILKGPWPWAHSFFMETKEHLFFIVFILALYVPFLTRLDLSRNAKARAMTLVVTALIILTGLAIEGAGAIISHGAKAAYMHGIGV